MRRPTRTTSTTPWFHDEAFEAMNDGHKQTKEAIDKLPPEQRKQYEEMMKKQKGEP